MPYNIFGEFSETNCACAGCRVVRANRDHVDGHDYRTRASAERAMFSYRSAHGRAPTYRYTPGMERHREVTPPTPRPEFTSMELVSQGGLWDMVVSNGPLDEAGLRELRDLTLTVSAGHPWRPYRPRPPLSPAEQRLQQYPRADPRKNYTWKPRTWTYNGKGPAYYGLEIEIRCGDYRVMNFAQAAIGALGHLKNDSSIGGGFELVTHPMSYDYAMRNFPWSVLPELEELGCTISPEINGIHVHVSRSAFKTQAHMLRWLKFIYRNRNQVIRLARRRTDRYGTFSEAVQKDQLAHIKAEKARLRQQAAQERYRDCPCYTHEAEYAGATRELEDMMRGDTTRKDRYQAVNTRNVDTLELRVFASTLGVVEAKAALQFAASSVEYTRQLTAAMVCAGGWRWTSYSAWLREHEKEYPELVHVNAHARMPNRPASKYTLSTTPRRGL